MRNSADPSPSPATDTILVLRAGDAIAEVAAGHGEFAQWIEQATGDVWHGAWFEHDLRVGEAMPDPSAYAAVVITGSIASVTEQAPWMERAAALIRSTVASHTPLLGICFGHQLMAYALGGEVQCNPKGREIGTVMLTRSGDDPLLAGLPQQFVVNSSHVDTVSALPPGAAVVASTALDQHAVLAFGENARGVQFHPEMNEHVIRGYVQARRHCLVEAGLDPDAIMAGTSETPVAREVLRNFIRHFVLASFRRAA